MKKTTFFKLPKFLIVHVNRFRYNARDQVLEKIHSIVQFSETMIISIEESTQKNVTYKLIGLINHTGNIDEGHYVAIVKSEEKWYKIDDEKVSEVKIKRKENQSPFGYIFFYERQEEEAK